MKFESEREAQVFAQTLHGLSDIIRYLDDTKAERNAGLARDLHAIMVKLRAGYYLKEKPLTMQDMLEAPGPHKDQ